MLRGMNSMHHTPSQTREFSSSYDPAYLKYTLGTPGPRFYSDLNQDVTPMIGFETGARHYGHALQHLNHHLNMQLDDLDSKVFELLLTSLAQANRFGSDLHICPILGENSAVHTLRTLILDTEVARRAGNLSHEGQQDTSVCRQRIRRLRSILTHDMGEIPGEMTSLASRTRNPALQELPEVEREVFRIHLTEAYRTALSTIPNYPAFYRFQGGVRQAVAAARVDDEQSQVTMANKLKAIAAAYDRNNPIEDLPPQIQGRIREWMYDFDTIEIKEGESSRERLFTGYSAKISEHTQGTRHLLRFGTCHPADTRLNVAFPDTHPNALKDPLSQSHPEAMIPLRFFSNMRLIKACRYMETELPGLFANAATEHEFRHARALRDLLYCTQAELLSVTRPIFDRRVLKLERSQQREDSYLTELQEQIKNSEDPSERSILMRTAGKYLEHKLIQDYQSACEYRSTFSGSAPQDRLLDFETRGRMQALYLHAVRVDYVPETTTPLILLERLPESLHDFASLARQNRISRSSPLSSLTSPPSKTWS
jgi:hypothetical protein